MKTISYILFLITLVIGMHFISCKSENKSNLILKEDRLIEVITDIQIAKAAIYKYPLNLRDSISIIYYSQIYKIHGIDEFELEHDLNELEKNPTKYKVLVDSVSQNLKKLMVKDIEDYE